MFNKGIGAPASPVDVGLETAGVGTLPLEVMAGMDCEVSLFTALAEG